MCCAVFLCGLPCAQDMRKSGTEAEESAEQARAPTASHDRPQPRAHTGASDLTGMWFHTSEIEESVRRENGGPSAEGRVPTGGVDR